jgi:hypothetical protein
MKQARVPCQSPDWVYQSNYQNYPLTIPYTVRYREYILQVTTAQ